MKQGKCSNVLKYYAKWPGDAVDSLPPSAPSPGKVSKPFGGVGDDTQFFFLSTVCILF